MPGMWVPGHGFVELPSVDPMNWYSGGGTGGWSGFGDYGFGDPGIGGNGGSTWDPWIDVPGTGGNLGIGVCPAGTQCVGLSPLGVCIGGCVPTGGGGGGGGGLVDPGTGGGGVVVGGNGSQTMQPLPANGCCPSGYHLNKTGYWRTENGGPVYVVPRSRCVRSRRRNPLNPRAADRAIGRLRSASKFGKYLAKISLPPKGSRR